MRGKLGDLLRFGLFKFKQNQFLLLSALLLIAGCAAMGLTKADTPGERFRGIIQKMAELCVNKKLKPSDSRCVLPKLQLADPLATPEGRFAHSIKIPDPLPEDSGYKPGMTPQEYFDHLCKTEAGEFIYKTVENVEGLYMMRPRQPATDYELEHLYALEDPYGHLVGTRNHPEEYFVQPEIGKYKFLEVPLINKVGSEGSGGKYLQYYRDPNAHPGKDYQTALEGKFVRVPYIVAQKEVSSLQSRYGYSWRGVRRPHDRELGIAGGELIILDLKTHEILAVRRGFIRTGLVRNLTGVWWLTGQHCSKTTTKTDAKFINQVLKPAS